MGDSGCINDDNILSLLGNHTRMPHMIKIFVLQISNASDEGCFDRDREYYTPINHEIRIYSNTEKLDFSDARYWNVIEELKKRILMFHGLEEHYGYTGDFDENHYREKPYSFLAKEICEKLNQVTGGNYFEAFDLAHYRETQCRTWDKNLYWDPKNSECCFEVTSSFLDFPGIDGYYTRFLNRSGFDKCEKLVHTFPTLHTQSQIRERQIEEEIRKLKEELSDVQDVLNRSDLRVKAFCRFIVPYLEKTLDKVNEIVKIYPSAHLSSCHFAGNIGNSFYPLNVVLELDEKHMVHTLIEHGAYEIADGTFVDARNYGRSTKQHSLDSLFKYCDESHCNMLKENLIRQNRWTQELESKYPTQVK